MPPKKSVPKPITLNSEQQAVVDAREGYWCCMAGPGSGKSASIVARFAALIKEGVSPDDILSLSFTKTAAKNLRDRVESLVGTLTTTRTAGAVTFHSLALSFAQEERNEFGFELAEFPLADEPTANKLSGESGRRFEVNPRDLRPVISLWKRKRLRPAAVIKSCEDKLDAKGLKLGLAYKDYEKRCREKGVLDFDSLILEMVEILDKKAEIRKRWGRKFIMCDETQDCSKIEWDLLKLLSKDHGNLLCVGDVSQCQPPETKVLTVQNHKGESPRFTWLEKPIKDLTEEDKVVSWTKHEQRLYTTKGREIQIASRPYRGHMLSVSCNENTTQMTPNHWVWARWNKEAFERKPYFVYLMFREDRGFRIGISHLRKSLAGSNCLTLRGTQEKADKLWVLGFVNNRSEAETREEILSLKYQIPQSVFHCYNGVAASEEQIKRIFSSVSLDGGFLCLHDHGKLFDYPLIEWPMNGRPKFHGYFRTAACNLVPEIMDLPTKEINRSSPIVRLERTNYEGLVYSLNVEHDHTYVSDGIPVGNCIYGFRGSDAKLFENMERMFPETKTLFLAANYRSTPEIIDFIRPIAASQELAARFHTGNAAGPEPEIHGFLSPGAEAAWVTAKIKESLNGK